MSAPMDVDDIGKAGASSSSSSYAAAPPAASASSTSSSSAAPATGKGGLSFSFTAKRPPPKLVHVHAPAPKPNENDGSRMKVEGVLTSAALAESHKQSVDTTYGKTNIVIPLIEKTNWRTKQLPPDPTRQKSNLVLSDLKARDRGENGSINFESESDIVDRAAAEKQQRESEAAHLPALQTTNEVAAASMSIEDQAIAALESQADAEENGTSANLPSQEQQEAFARAAPILIANALPGNSASLNEEERLALDVDQRPSEASLEDYERVPIEEFGAGMLRGMGWKGLGDTIGGINKAVVQPIQFQPRGERMGLGADFAKVKNNRGPQAIVKPGEKREQAGVQRVGGESNTASTIASAADMKAKTLRSLGSRLIQVHSQKLRDNALVEIMEGPHRKSYGRVVTFEDPAKYESQELIPVEVKLNLTLETVKVRRGQIELLDEYSIPADHPALEDRTAREKRLEKEKTEMENRRKAATTSEKEKSSSSSSAGTKRDRSTRSRSRSRDRKKSRNSRSRSRSRSRDRKSSSSSYRRSSRSRSRDRDRDRSRERDRDRDRYNDRQPSSSSSNRYSSSSSSSSSSTSTKPQWIRPHIRVRFVSRSFQNGKYYEKKGVVVDVPSALNVLVRPDGSSTLVEGVREKDLETVIPKAGSLVMILAGEHKGSVGKLLLKQAERQVASVQLEEDLDIINVGFDDIAEYVR